MNLLSAENLSKSFNERQLFQSLNLGIGLGEKIAIVGANGAGKSTLMKILAGKESSDSGTVGYKKDLKWAYLEQEPQFGAGQTIWAAIFEAESEALQTLQAYDQKMRLGDTSSEDFFSLLEKMDRLGAWEIEAKIKEILGKLGLHDTSLLVENLSGGQKKRVALAKVLLSEPELLLLDEPTNHLDLDTIEWLESYLAASQVSLLLITHDRYFLDRICNVIFELEKGKIYRHQGNYAQFLENKAARQADLQATTEKARNLYKRELDWIRRQPKARGTKAKYRVDAFEDVKEKAHQNLNQKKVEISLKGSRQGKKIIEISDLQFVHQDGKMIVENFTYAFQRGERIGLVGKNGVGKTSFIELLMGNLSPQKGKIDLGDNTKIGYYTQKNLTFNENERIIDAVKAIAEVIEVAKGQVITASQMLTNFLFEPSKQYDVISKLSGGEKRRLQLLLVLMKNPNFLILDEPTNDLDLTTLGVLEDFLDNFEGCLILVSHDRYFMDKLTEHLFIFEGEGKIKDFPGNYSDFKNYLSEEKSRSQEQKENKKMAPAPEMAKSGSKLSYKEKQEFDLLEKEISNLEKKKKQLSELLASGETDYDKINEWSNEFNQILADLETKELRWLELSEMQ
ncbi:ABC-F family ATP-binding cassette domain-containing protein [Hugenholtzia roseola]|uniref:ABC-F family ATP-binding cassette domain-containing protein n=1 Tax=Hugenholtzia roseola TaxID=1002 RepID=UPI0003FC78AB|nr:ABC-F family ATP-binding cassette domain-containing protein [Hugenholtzia roseola]